MSSCLTYRRQLSSSNASVDNGRWTGSINPNEQRTSTPIPSRNLMEHQQQTTYLDKMTEILSKRQEEMVRMRQEHDERVREEMRRLLERLEREYQDDLQEVTAHYYDEIQHLETRRQMDDAIPQQSADDHFDVVNTSAMTYAEFRRSLGNELETENENLEHLSFASLNDSYKLRPDEPEFHPNDGFEQQARQPTIYEVEYEGRLWAATALAETSYPQSFFDEKSVFEEDVYISYTSFASDRNLDIIEEEYEDSNGNLWAATAPAETSSPQSFFDEKSVFEEDVYVSFTSYASDRARDRMERLLEESAEEHKISERHASFHSNMTHVHMGRRRVLAEGTDTPAPTRQDLRDNYNGCWSIFDDHEADLDHLEEQIAADNADETAVRERKGELRWEYKESGFWCFCSICFSELARHLPVKRAVFTNCGHVLCPDCAENLELVAREERRELACPVCKHLKFYAHVVEEENV